MPTYAPAWRYGGPIVSVHGLCRALARRGHRVDVYTTNVDGPGDLDVQVGVPVDVDGVSVTYFRCNGPRRLFWSSTLHSALTSNVGSFDVVHAHACFLMPPLWAARHALRAGVPYVFSPRGMLVQELISRRSAWLKRAWIRFFDGRTVREAAAVHVTSEREREDLHRVLPSASRLQVVANGVDELGANSLRISSPIPHILFLGRVNWKKGIDLAIRMLAMIPGTRLRVVGNDEEGLRPQLEQLAEAEGVSDRIDWLGPLYGEQKDRELASAEAFVMPSISENFGNTVLEAMSAGLPVVCSPEVGAAELVVTAGCGLVVPRTPEAYAEAVLRILADTRLRSQMAQAGRQMARKNSWDLKAEEMEGIYESAVGLSDCTSK